MAPFTVLRAILQYLFLIFITRIVGRRPGKQLTPFEFVLVFYLGGLTLTGMVGVEASTVNAFSQVIIVALTYIFVVWARSKSPRLARFIDGTPLMLMEGGRWRADTMREMRIADDDVMAMARDQGLRTFEDIDTATLERNGEISIIPREDDEEESDSKDGGSMSASGAATKPVEDSVKRVDDAVAIGEDLDFQRRWWKFEHIVWWLFGFILAADLAGALGNGPLANVKRISADGSLSMEYERIERATTPSIIVLHPGASAIHDGKMRIFVSDSVVKELGNQRISPQPASSIIGQGGITYEFPISALPATIQFALEPSHPGLHHFSVGVPGSDQIAARVVVLP
jgi:uncharacterized membrane protein YcaP (DUF421 family)